MSSADQTLSGLGELALVDYRLIQHLLLNAQRRPSSPSTGVNSY